MKNSDTKVIKYKLCCLIFFNSKDLIRKTNWILLLIIIRFHMYHAIPRNFYFTYMLLTINIYQKCMSQQNVWHIDKFFFYYFLPYWHNDSKVKLNIHLFLNKYDNLQHKKSLDFVAKFHMSGYFYLDSIIIFHSVTLLILPQSHIIFSYVLKDYVQKYLIENQTKTWGFFKNVINENQT